VRKARKEAAMHVRERQECMELSHGRITSQQRADGSVDSVWLICWLFSAVRQIASQILQ